MAGAVSLPQPDWQGLTRKLNDAFVPALYDDKLRVVQTMVMLASATETKADEIDQFLWPIAKLDYVYPHTVKSAAPVVSDLFKRCFASIDPECGASHSHEGPSQTDAEHAARRECFDRRVAAANALVRKRLVLARFGPVRAERDLRFFLSSDAETELSQQELAGVYVYDKGCSLVLGDVGWRQVLDPSARDKERLRSIMREHCGVDIEFPEIPDPNPVRTAAFFCTELLDYGLRDAVVWTGRHCPGARIELLESVYNDLMQGDDEDVNGRDLLPRLAAAYAGANAGSPKS